MKQTLILTEIKTEIAYYKYVYGLIADKDEYQLLYLSPNNTYATFKEEWGKSIYYIFVFYNKYEDYSWYASNTHTIPLPQETVDEAFNKLHNYPFNKDIGIMIRQAWVNKEV